MTGVEGGNSYDMAESMKPAKAKEAEGQFLKSKRAEVDETDEEEEKDLNSSGSESVVHIRSDVNLSDGNKSVEDHKKGILKHQRTYSNKHVDFNLDIEFVPFDESKDYTIEIQIVEQMPKKVISYAALFAQQAIEDQRKQEEGELKKMSKSKKHCVNCGSKKPKKLKKDSCSFKITEEGNSEVVKENENIKESEECLQTKDSIEKCLNDVQEDSGQPTEDILLSEVEQAKEEAAADEGCDCQDQYGDHNEIDCKECQNSKTEVPNVEEQTHEKESEHKHVCPEVEDLKQQNADDTETKDLCNEKQNEEKDGLGIASQTTNVEKNYLGVATQKNKEEKDYLGAATQTNNEEEDALDVFTRTSNEDVLGIVAQTNIEDKDVLEVVTQTNNVEKYDLGVFTQNINVKSKVIPEVTEQSHNNNNEQTVNEKDSHKEIKQSEGNDSHEDNISNQEEAVAKDENTDGKESINWAEEDGQSKSVPEKDDEMSDDYYDTEENLNTESLCLLSEIEENIPSDSIEITDDSICEDGKKSEEMSVPKDRLENSLVPSDVENMRRKIENEVDNQCPGETESSEQVTQTPILNKDLEINNNEQMEVRIPMNVPVDELNVEEGAHIKLDETFHSDVEKLDNLCFDSPSVNEEISLVDVVEPAFDSIINPNEFQPFSNESDNEVGKGDYIGPNDPNIVGSNKQLETLDEQQENQNLLEIPPESIAGDGKLPIKLDESEVPNQTNFCKMEAVGSSNCEINNSR